MDLMIETGQGRPQAVEFFRRNVHAARFERLGGVTNAAENDPFFGAGLGFRASFIEFGIEGGRFQNILPKGVLDALNQLQRDRGLPELVVGLAIDRLALAAETIDIAIADILRRGRRAIGRA